MKREPIDAVIRRHAGEILRLPGVVGIGEGAADGEPCIDVLVESRDRTLAGAIPPVLDGYPVRVEVSGRFRAG